MKLLVAGVVECRELHTLSAWDGTAFSWYCDEERDDDPALNVSEPLKVLGGVGYYDHKYPAYDAGFLLGMLPACRLYKHGNGVYIAFWRDYTTDHTLEASSRTNPANALARLAIALFHAGVLLNGKETSA